MPQKVWVISELYYPEQTSTGYFLTKIAEGLAHRYQVQVICAQPTYSARGIRAPRYEERNGVRITRCLTATLNKDNLLFRFINLATISISIFLNAVRQFKKGDCVIVVTNPPLLPFFVVFAASLKRARSVLLVHDVYPEVLVATRMINAKSIAFQIISKLSQILYSNVEKIIVLGRDMEQLVLGKTSEGQNQIAVIPNWADVDEVLPEERSRNRLLKALGISEFFVAQYCGNMGRTHGLKCLLESIDILNTESNIHFLLIGSGAKKQWLEETAIAKGLSNITVLPACPREDLPTYLNACDLAIISFVPGMAGISVPSRMYNIMAAGKPIIAVADNNSELAMVVREERIGWVVPPDQPDKVAEAVLEARAHPELLRQMGRRARLAAERKYSFEKAIKAYTDVIASLDQGR